jgi:hypothetical protein
VMRERTTFCRPLQASNVHVDTGGLAIFNQGFESRSVQGQFNVELILSSGSKDQMVYRFVSGLYN